MLRSRFQNDLNELHVSLDIMCHLVTAAIENCVKAFKTQDLVLAKEIIAGDKKINDIERSIESRCLSLILKEQPIATDLRDISTALKVVTDLERIGDHAADIAEIVLEVEEENVYRMIEHIPAMAKLTKKMVVEAIDCFHRRDLAGALEIKKIDKDVDNLFNQIRDELIAILQEGSQHADIIINILMIAKYFERIGDHAVNICEWIEFNQTGAVNNKRII